MASLDVIAAIDITATAAVAGWNDCRRLSRAAAGTAAPHRGLRAVVHVGGPDLRLRPAGPGEGVRRAGTRFRLRRSDGGDGVRCDTSSAERWQRVLAHSDGGADSDPRAAVLGVEFLLLWSAGRLTAPFAPLAGWGDIITGVTAVPVAWAVWRKAAGWRPLAVIWNLFGAADLIARSRSAICPAPGSPLQLFAVAKRADDDDAVLGADPGRIWSRSVH